MARGKTEQVQRVLGAERKKRRGGSGRCVTCEGWRGIGVAVGDAMGEDGEVRRRGQARVTPLLYG